ncbi:MAG: hypothetical protein UT65_C0032G0008 [Parcubacteria group bacterium GW2011_GWF2_39_8b]|uniref:Uncharacterized protein n=3 Tax=Candidatus Zambryskiibacteriota TaxID=1817925 RepID=A0A1G2T651_9BACT|nr:MAG: hypothetical protein UT65_C0032G0008 [Parcubacteria group bacterium GW2011_GWF2_39_8b]KKR45922.1 MAG: hypothetical protein UT81_C0004G0020 [Parcubacteria group bacterium GW2011_GWA2_40_14]OHA92750.1 MAG: hypothetical protein A2W58_03170 [Candidatus Zambryskibacteria bacterium RIFCSPHIGHO2_02_38_10.5]OHA97094.1 MAG: hypothetical protein A3C63_00900 [Candidatus Zambryskibacteria bacterium RIFCSPHIGHO2_02_FULL_39_82]OHA99748.1 MAG: hypothetical protein A3E32_00745 [Candidatus Zambryskibact
MRKIFKIFAGNKVSPQDISDKKVERIKKPRAPKVARTGEKLSSKQWEYLENLPCWNFFEWKKLYVMKKHYPRPVTPDQFREEFGSEGLWVQSSFININQKLKDLRLPYRISAVDGSFQVFVVAPVS